MTDYRMTGADRDALLADLDDLASRAGGLLSRATRPRTLLRSLEPWVDVSAFVLGATEPTAENTGPRVAEASLTNYAGSFTNVTNGDVIDRLLITGQVRPTNTGTATFRDCLVTGANVPTTGTSYYPLVDQVSTPSGLNTYEHCELRPAVRSYKMVGFKGGNFRAYRCKVSGMTDAFSPHGSGTAWKTVEIEGCYSDAFYVDADPNQGDNLTHNDACQAAGKLTRLWVIGNAVGATGRPRTSNFLPLTGQGIYTTDGIKVNRNWFRGHATEGSTINIPLSTSDVNALEVIGNRVWSDGKTPRVLINSGLRATFAATIYGNVDENGNPTTISNA